MFSSGSVRIGVSVTNFEAYLRTSRSERQHYNGAIAALPSILLIPTILARALTEPLISPGGTGRVSVSSTMAG
jgi:hypothetical protein